MTKKQRFSCHCGNCDSDCTITIKATEDVVEPLFCPFCGDDFDKESDEWPDDRENEG